MLNVRSILVPTDFSPVAHRAYRLGLLLAQRLAAELHLLHALRLTEVEPVDPTDEGEGAITPERLFPGTLSELVEQLHAEQERSARVRLEEHAEAASGRVTLVPSFRRGTSPASVILAYAEEHKVDLVVIGSHGRRGIRRALLGSVAEEVIRLATCPVLTARGETPSRPGDGFGRLLVPVDFSAHTRVALRHAGELARLFGSEVHLLHVIHELLQPDFYYPSGTRRLKVEVLRDKALEKLGELTGDLPADLPATGSHVRIGRAAHEIVELAGELPADLIVISSHGLTGVPAMLLGSQTAFVVRRAPCSVLTVKPYGKLLTGE